MEIQTIVSRNLPPGTPAVISVCKIHSGEADNIIPGYLFLKKFYFFS
jgi:metal-dependent amidase/aminoacylase/carboxypeptidase family protein